MSEASGIPSWAVPGAKVVCVGDGWEGRLFGFLWWVSAAGPAKGEVCTVTEAFFDNEGPAIRIVEWPVADGFNLEGFRPLVTRSQEQDVAIFRPILDQVPVVA